MAQLSRSRPLKAATRSTISEVAEDRPVLNPVDTLLTSPLAWNIAPRAAQERTDAIVKREHKPRRGLTQAQRPRIGLTQTQREAQFPPGWVNSTSGRMHSEV